jgi:hypothetical protein
MGQIGHSICIYYAIIAASYVIIFRCCECLIVGGCFFLLPFDFLVELLHCSESVVVMFYSVLFYVFPRSTFLYLYGFIHFSRFRVCLRRMWSFNSTIKTNKLIIYSKCECDSDSRCVETGTKWRSYIENTTGCIPWRWHRMSWRSRQKFAYCIDSRWELFLGVWWDDVKKYCLLPL